MAHNTDGTQIVTVEQARAFMLDNDCDELRADIENVLGENVVEIDEDGDVRAGRGRGGLNVLRPAALLDLVRSLPDR
jgi:hypothetical protein